MTTAGTTGVNRASAGACIGIASMATRRLLDELTETYTVQTSQAVTVLSTGGVDAFRRVSAGEGFDFVVLASDAIEELARTGRVDPATRVDVVRSCIALAVAAGAPRSGIESESDIRDAVLHAKAVGYSTGPSGAHFLRLMERWGLTGDNAPPLVQAPPGIPVGALIARGDVTLGFQQLGELMHEPGVDVVGLLPAPIQAVTVFAAAVCAASRHAATAGQFLAFLASAQTTAAKRRQGMEPA
jgi:molybdate transport system substrate-binding protein